MGVLRKVTLGLGMIGLLCIGARAQTWQPVGVDSNGNITVPGKIQLNGTATLAAACSSTGLIAQDGTGVLLSCQSGTWKQVGAFNASSVTTRSVASPTTYGWGACSASASCAADEALTGCSGTSVAGRQCTMSRWSSGDFAWESCTALATCIK